MIALLSRSACASRLRRQDRTSSFLRVAFSRDLVRHSLEAWMRFGHESPSPGRLASLTECDCHGLLVRLGLTKLRSSVGIGLALVELLDVGGDRFTRTTTLERHYRFSDPVTCGLAPLARGGVGAKGIGAPAKLRNRGLRWKRGRRLVR